MEFAFHMPTKVVFGRGALDRLPSELDGLGAEEVLVVAGRGSMRRTGMLKRVLKLLEGRDVGVYEGVVSNPQADMVDEIAVEARGVDALVGLGGGSVLDAAKAASVVSANGGKTAEYLNGRDTPKPGPAVVAVPTTSGTGSEVTEVSVISAGEGLKRSFRSVYMYPAVALDDPELTKTMPREVTASSGLDALTHAVEALVSTRSQPICDVLCMEAAGVIIGSLESAYMEGEDMESREAMMLGSLMAGFGITHAAAGLAHGVSYGLHRVAGTSHGLACGILLPHVMRFNLGYDGGKYSLLARHCGFKNAEDLICRIEGLKRALDVPERLSDAGATSDDADAMAEVSMTGSAKVNPRPVDREAIASFIRSIM